MARSMWQDLWRSVQSLVRKQIASSGEGSLIIDAEALEEVRAKLLATDCWLETLTIPPTNDDFALFGKFIQTYCFADLNVRRLLEALNARVFSNPSVNPYRLNDTDLLQHLRTAVGQSLWKPNIASGLTIAIDILEMHRIHRNHFAHWAVKRYAELDVFVMLSLNAREADRRGIVKEGDSAAAFGLVPIATVKDELRKLVGHCDYIARLVVAIEKSELDPLADAMTQ